MRMILGFLATLSVISFTSIPSTRHQILFKLKKEVAIKIDKGLKRKMAPYARKLTNSHSSFLFEKPSK